MSDTNPMPGTQLPNSHNRDVLDVGNLPVLFQESTSSSSGAIAENGEQFLRLSLASNTLALLPVQYLSEVLTIPNSQIMPIPHMTPWVMGAYNWRGEILWMVDLGHLLGLPPWYQDSASFSTFTAVVLHRRSEQRVSNQWDSHTVGLVVYQAEDMEWCNPNLIQPPIASTVKSELAPFLRGYWLTEGENMLAVLDGEAIINAISQSSPRSGEHP